MSSTSTGTGRYTLVAIVLHWAVAVLIAAVGGAGLLLKSLPKGTQPFWLNAHAAVGLVFLALVLARLAWRLSHRPPEYPSAVHGLSRYAAHAIHALMYGLMLAIAALGIAAFFYHGRVLNFGVFSIDLGLVKNRDIYHPAQDFHRWLAYGLFAAVAFHVAAALWHGLALRDEVMGRMLLGPRGKTIAAPGTAANA